MSTRATIGGSNKRQELFGVVHRIPIKGKTGASDVKSSIGIAVLVLITFTNTGMEDTPGLVRLSIGSSSRAVEAEAVQAKTGVGDGGQAEMATVGIALEGATMPKGRPKKPTLRQPPS
jgi:hypothetical protein